MILIIDRIEDDVVVAVMKNGIELILRTSDFDILLYEGDVIEVGFIAKKVNEPNIKEQVEELHKELIERNKELNNGKLLEL